MALRRRKIWTARRTPLWRRLLLWVLSIAVLLLVLSVVVLSTFDWNRAKPWINERASAALQRSFAIEGDLSVHWRRASDLGGWRAWMPMPEIRAADIRVGNPDWAGGADFATLKQAEISVRLLPLLLGHVDLPYLRLSAPNVALLRKDPEHANWILPSAAGEPSRWTLQLGEIRLAEAKISIDDKVSAVDLALTVEPLTESISYAQLIGSAELDVGKKGGGAPPTRGDVQDYAYQWTAEGKYRGAPVKGTGKVGSVIDLREGRAFPLQADARLGGLRVILAGTLTDPAAPSGLDLRLKISGGSMAQIYPYTGVALPDTPPFSTSGHLIAQIQPDESRYRYENFVGTVGDSDLAGSLIYATSGARPKLEGSLRSERLQFADLGPLIGADTDRKDSSTVSELPPGRLLPSAEFRSDRWNAMDADVQFEGVRILQDARLPIQQLVTRIRMDDAKLTLEPLAFGLAGGKVSGSLALDASKKPLRGSVNLAARKLELKQLFPGFKAMDASFGEINANIELRSSGQSVAALFARSNGDLRLLMNDGAISKQLMETAGLNVGNIVITRLFGDKEVRIDCAAANFGVADGLMTSKLAVFDTDNAVIDISGTVNFADEQLNLDIQPHTKGLRILSLRSPLYVKGTLANPDVGVRKAALIAKGGAALALASLAAPAAALLPLISPSHGKQDNRCENLLSQLRAGK